MPNRNAKDRKRKRILANKQLAKQGRTAKQYKKWFRRKSIVYRPPVFFPTVTLVFSNTSL